MNDHVCAAHGISLFGILSSVPPILTNDNSVNISSDNIGDSISESLHYVKQTDSKLMFLSNFYIYSRSYFSKLSKSCQYLVCYDIISCYFEWV